jgi:hypothetical protein
MARIRTIKPEFPQSETTGRLSRDARLLFIQLWTIVDDEGRARAASRMLASLLYPYDDDARDLMGGWLAELERENVIRLYVAEGATYLEIVNWLKHQRIDHPSKSRLPAFTESSRALANPSLVLAPDLGPVPSTKNTCAVAKATRPKHSIEFEEFWKAYPRRQGANPKTPAFKAFDAAVKSGADPAEIIAGATKTAIADRDKIGTPFIPQAVKWLRDRRWEDYAGPVNPTSVVTITPADRSWNAWKSHFRDTGRNVTAAIMDKCASDGKPFTVQSEWPPGMAA